MCVKFKSRVDMWVMALLCIVIVLPIVIMLVSYFSWLTLFITALTLLIVWSVTFGISYIIDGQELTVKCGWVTLGKVNIMTVSKIESSHNPLAAPAASDQRIAIYHSESRQPIVISPSDLRRFIDTILAINPEVIVKL